MPLFYPQVMPAIITDDGAYIVAPTSTTVTANTLYMRAFTVFSTTIVVAAGWNMGATATGKTNIAIYTLAGNLVSGSDTGQVSNVANSDVKSTYATAVTLAPGQYFVAFASSNSTDTYLARGSNADSKSSSYRVATNAVSAGAMPSTTGTLNLSGIAPVVSLYTQNGLS
jgi:hypothetical protein